MEQEVMLKEIITYIFHPSRVISEGIVDKPADLNVATVMSMGFPASKGGLIFWADLVGAAYIVKRLEQFAAQVGSSCLERLQSYEAYWEGVEIDVLCCLGGASCI